jgi:Glycosyltransferase
VSGHNSILLTGYVEGARAPRFLLNALALVSPSLVEGFGIPVLDAAWGCVCRSPLTTT